MTGLLNAGVLDSRTVIVMNHEHENDDTGLIEEGGKQYPIGLLGKLLQYPLPSSGG